MLTWKHLCWSLSLIKLQALRASTLLKRDSNTGVFLRILRKLEEHHFHRKPPDNYFWLSSIRQRKTYFHKNSGNFTLWDSTMKLKQFVKDSLQVFYQITVLTQFPEHLIKGLRYGVGNINRNIRLHLVELSRVVI